MNHDPLLPAAGDDAREQRRARQSLDQRQRDANLVWLMSTPRGRSVMWQLLGGLEALGSSLNTDPIVMAHTEGQRLKPRELIRRLHRLCPADFLEMLNENEG